MADALLEVCPWCRRNPVAARGPHREPSCEPCLTTVRAVRCGCGTLVYPEMGLYEVRPNGAVSCCHCLGSLRCGVPSCEGCSVCDPQPTAESACHWCGAVECARGECLKDDREPIERTED